MADDPAERQLIMMTAAAKRRLAIENFIGGAGFVAVLWFITSQGWNRFIAEFLNWKLWVLVFITVVIGTLRFHRRT
jgi:hypothetical protein